MRPKPEIRKSAQTTRRRSEGAGTVGAVDLLAQLGICDAPREGCQGRQVAT